MRKKRIVLVGALTILINLFFIYNLEKKEITIKKIRAQNYSEKQIEIYKNVIKDYMLILEILEIFLIKNKYGPESFEEIVKHIYKEQRSIRAIQIAPDGIIKFSYPLEKNKTGMTNLFTDQNSKEEAEYARDNRKTTFTGPVDLYQGGKGMIVRKPIYNSLDNKDSNFWGFLIIVLDYEKLIKESQFQDLAKVKYNYQIIQSKLINNSKDSKILMKSGTVKDPLSIEYDIFERKRTLEIEPIGGWQNPFQRVIRYILFIFITGVFYFTKINFYSKKKLQKELTEEQALNKCISMLYRPESVEASISKLLSVLDSFYNGDRTYIFEYHSHQQIIHNTYEWTKDNAKSQINEFNRLDSKVIEKWIPILNKSEGVRIENIEKELAKNSIEYDFFKSHNIFSLIIHPLFDSNGEVNGFIGVDNPKKNIKNSNLIEKISFFIAEFLDKDRLIKKLDFLSFSDKLSGVKNYHAYSHTLEELISNPKYTIGIAFFDINGLKLINDTYGHERGDLLIMKCADLLKKHFKDKVYRIGGDEFVLIIENIKEDSFFQKINFFKSDLNKKDFNMSFGAKWYKNSENIKEKLKMVDQIMYKEKFDYYSKKND